MLVWSDKLNVGIELIDGQHQELFCRIQMLLDAIGTEKISETEKMLDFLADYVYMHFYSEEQLQINSNYPEYEAHKEEHKDFTSQFVNIRREYMMKESDPIMVDKICKFTQEWLYKHIENSDAAFATYYQNLQQ